VARPESGRRVLADEAVHRLADQVRVARVPGVLLMSSSTSAMCLTSPPSVMVDAAAVARMLLELLQNQPGITAARLAERLRVSDRAARPYIGILREAGIPVESTRGPHGGYRVGRGLRLAPLMFTATEALGLVMAALDGEHMAEPVAGALGKIMRVLPEPVAAPAEAVLRIGARAPDDGAAVPDPEITAVLVRACAEHLSDGWRYRVEVVVDAPVADVTRWWPRHLGRCEEVDEHTTRILATTDEPDWYAVQLLGLKAPFHIVGPPELRAAAARLMRAASTGR
jgi:biotin operon repressor